MSADKYPSIFSHQMKAIVYIYIYIYLRKTLLRNRGLHEAFSLDKREIEDTTAD